MILSFYVFSPYLLLDICIYICKRGKKAEKVTTSLLKLIFTLELASEYSWKGQKGKKKLHDHHIFKVNIGKSLQDILYVKNWSYIKYSFLITIHFY